MGFFVYLSRSTLSWNSKKKEKYQVYLECLFWMKSNQS